METVNLSLILLKINSNYLLISIQYPFYPLSLSYIIFQLNISLILFLFHLFYQIFTIIFIVFLPHLLRKYANPYALDSFAPHCLHIIFTSNYPLLFFPFYYSFLLSVFFWFQFWECWERGNAKNKTFFFYNFFLQYNFFLIPTFPNSQNSIFCIFIVFIVFVYIYIVFLLF